MITKQAEWLFAQVARHLSKLFDNMATLKFKQNDEGEDIKEAVGMYSKEKEYVNFDKICDCHGQVKIRCRFFAYTGKT